MTQFQNIESKLRNRLTKLSFTGGKAINPNRKSIMYLAPRGGSRVIEDRDSSPVGQVIRPHPISEWPKGIQNLAFMDFKDLKIKKRCKSYRSQVNEKMIENQSELKIDKYNVWPQNGMLFGEPGESESSHRSAPANSNLNSKDDYILDLRLFHLKFKFRGQSKKQPE